MSIHDLLEKFDAKDIRVQFMDENILNIDSNTHGSKVTFGTDALTPGSLVAGSYPVGVLVWIPRDKWKEKMAK